MQFPIYDDDTVVGYIEAHRFDVLNAHEETVAENVRLSESEVLPLLTNSRLFFDWIEDQAFFVLVVDSDYRLDVRRRLSDYKIEWWDTAPPNKMEASFIVSYALVDELFVPKADSERVLSVRPDETTDEVWGLYLWSPKARYYRVGTVVPVSEEEAEDILPGVTNWMGL